VKMMNNRRLETCVSGLCIMKKNNGIKVRRREIYFSY